MASDYLLWKYRDVKPEEKPEYNRKQKLRNWWHYHKWWVLLAAALLLAGADLLRGVLASRADTPDYQLACVVSAPLAEEDVRTLESALASLGQDCNGDGRVLVRVHVYADMSASPDADAAQYAAAAQVQLMADMETCDSYFFLCTDPAALQSNYQILAGPSGALIGAGQDPLVFPWAAVRSASEALAPLQGLDGLFLARRGFWQDRACTFRPQCDALWEILTGSLPAEAAADPD